jgi:hypothetical protein
MMISETAYDCLKTEATHLEIDFSLLKRGMTTENFGRDKSDIRLAIIYRFRPVSPEFLHQMDFKEAPRRIVAADAAAEAGPLAKTDLVHFSMKPFPRCGCVPSAGWPTCGLAICGMPRAPAAGGRASSGDIPRPRDGGERTGFSSRKPNVI